MKIFRKNSEVNSNTIESHAKVSENISQSFYLEGQVFDLSNGSILLPN